MNAEEFLSLIEDAPKDSGKKSKGSMAVNHEEWEQIVDAIRQKQSGVMIRFDQMKAMVGSDSNSLNNFVYQLSRAFKANNIPLHAGQRHRVEEIDGEKQEVDYVALNLRS